MQVPERQREEMRIRPCVPIPGDARKISVEVLTKAELQWIIKLIQEGKEHAFYLWGKWLRQRAAVLLYDKHECQSCKRKGRYRKAIIVHHVKHLKRRPDLALSLFDTETGERQLESLCKQCHEEEHPESQRQFKNIRNPITEERWD